MGVATACAALRDECHRQFASTGWIDQAARVAATKAVHPPVSGQTIAAPWESLFRLKCMKGWGHL
jgi:hypothetical protein